MDDKVMVQVHENIKKYRKLNNMTQEKMCIRDSMGTMWNRRRNSMPGASMR